METNHPLSLLERLNEWISQSITVKLLSIGILILILLIPKEMINDLIVEREARMEETVHEVTDMWSRSQTITGPILTIPYKTYIESDDKDKKELTEVIRNATFLPDELTIATSIEPEERHRGIFKVIVYKAKLKISGSLPMPAFSELGVKDSDVLWQNAVLNIGITDLRGIEEQVYLQYGGEKLAFQPGALESSLINSGIHLPVRDTSLYAQQFTIDINLRGSEELYFVPVGKTTDVTMSSTWSDPSFTGAFPTRESEITEAGFKANWQVLHFNRNYPQSWTSAKYNIDESAFGVNLLVAADHYQKSLRTSKYSILIIALSFLMFFLVEVTKKMRIHAFQYILIGLALLIFYTLLLSISEHVGYDLAYLISAVSVIGLIGFYSYSVLGNRQLALVLTALLVMVYGFIFIMIQLETMALLVGSVGLFVILAITMYATRKIKWYV